MAAALRMTLRLKMKSGGWAMGGDIHVHGYNICVGIHHLCVYMSAHVCMCGCMRVCVCVHACVYMYVCVCVYV